MNSYDTSTRPLSADRAPAVITVDNLMRRALRIQDPRNVHQVAGALLARYTDEAAKIKREQQGLPFVIAQPVAVFQPAANGTQGVIRPAMDSLERTLNALLTDVQLADIVSELRGWATQIRRAAVDGVAAARYALDPNERDRAFAARVTLGEFARLARYAGAVTACAQAIYCRLAQSCDYLANLILIAIGDALIDAGITRSASIPQVPAATLRSRRDQIITGLHHLMMVPTADADQDDWPRGTVALNQLYISLEQAGAPDLRAFLDEGYLSRQLDDLVDLAIGATPDGLRALGSTAALTVQRLQRFVIIAQRLIVPPSPPLTVFLSAIQLFVQGFAASNAGYRLPYLSRSPLLIAGVSPNAATDQPTLRLLGLANLRSAIAQATDCFCCSCDDDDAADLIVAGKALFDIDRAIDLYAIGTDLNGNGDAELRAAAFGIVALEAANLIDEPAEGAETQVITEALRAVATGLRWPNILKNSSILIPTTLIRASSFFTKCCVPRNTTRSAGGCWSRRWRQCASKISSSATMPPSENCCGAPRRPCLQRYKPKSAAVPGKNSSSMPVRPPKSGYRRPSKPRRMVPAMTSVYRSAKHSRQLRQSHQEAWK